MEETQFLVQWDEHPTHLATRLGYLLEHQSLVDVTLMCNTHTLKVHRAVLAACSPYFERQLGNHPLIVLKDMKFSVLKSLVEFMYCGETSVSEENLTPLLEAAKFFEVKGLAAMTKESVRYSNNPAVRLNGTTPQLNQTPAYMRGSGTRGRGRGRGRPPLTSKVSSPTEPAQILLSLSGNQPSPQLFTTSRNVKIDPSVLGDSSKNKVIADSQPRRRGRRRSALNTAIRERILRDSEGSEDTSPLLSSLLAKSDGSLSQSPENSKYLQTLKNFGLPTDVPILYDNGQGKLVKLTESVLNNVICADSNIQFHITEGTLQDSELAPSCSVPSTLVTSKKIDNTMCEMVFDKENKNFVIKETMSSFSKEDEETDRLNDTDLESLKNGAVTEVESDPEAVVMFEVTDNKKVQKCVLSAKDINNLRVLNEQLSKQKSQLASMINGMSAAEMLGDAQITELKLKISKTTSVLAQIIEKVQGLKNIKELSTKILNESPSPPKINQQSQVVQLEFIDGNGEKIEGYQVEGTVVENKLEKKRDRENGKEGNDLMCLLDMVCDDNDRNNLISPEDENSQVEEDKDGTMILGGDPSDALMEEGDGEEKEDMNYHLVINNHNLGEQNMSYENIEDIMTESNGNISIENKAQDLKYIIDNDGNIINQDESYVVYHDVKEEMTSNEYVIYDGSESVLPDMTGGNNENFDVEEEEDSQVRNEEDCGTEGYIVYSNENKTNLNAGMKQLSPSVETSYIVYSDDNPDRSQDSLHNKQSGDKSDFVIFPPQDISEDDVDCVDSLLEKPSKSGDQSSDLLVQDEEFVDNFSDECHKTSIETSELIHKRRSSSNSDSSDKSLSNKKPKLSSLQDDVDSSS